MSLSSLPSRHRCPRTPSLPKSPLPYCSDSSHPEENLSGSHCCYSTPNSSPRAQSLCPPTQQTTQQTTHHHIASSPPDDQQHLAPHSNILASSQASKERGFRFSASVNQEDKTSPAQLLSRIYEFLCDLSSQTQDLIIALSPPTYHTIQAWISPDAAHLWEESGRYLSIKTLEQLRYNYQPTTGILRIYMPSTIHNTIAEVLGEEIRDQFLMTQFFSREEFRRLRFVHGTNIPLPTHKRRNLGSCPSSRKRKPIVYEKQPDLAIRLCHLNNPLSRLYPQVVFEVGRSQTEESLVEDARQWLVGTEGQTSLAILFCVNEGAPINTDTDDDADGDSSSACDSESDNEKFGELITQRSSLVTSWVGPLTVFFEVWRYDATAENIVLDKPRQYLCRDGVRVTEAASPVLTFTRKNFGLPPPNEEAECRIDLSELMDEIEEAREMEAVQRIIKAKRNRGKERGDDPRNDDYEPEY